MTARGDTSIRRLWALVKKYRSIAEVTSKLSIAPSLRGATTSTPGGVRPSISLARVPISSTLGTPRASFSMATSEGSERTTPWPEMNTRQFDVPRSTARSFEKSPRNLSKIMKTRAREAMTEGARLAYPPRLDKVRSHECGRAPCYLARVRVTPSPSSCLFGGPAPASMENWKHA